MFQALIFSLYASGFVPRCALEVDDGTEIRLAKICKIVEACKYGIHDLSRATLDRKTRLARFNMPLELGLFLGCKWFGGKRHNSKSCIILEGKRWDYRMFISDIAGQDIHAHEHDVSQLICHIRDWLRTTSRNANMPSSGILLQRYASFQRALPQICKRMRTRSDKLLFVDFAAIVQYWLKANRMRMIKLREIV